MKKSTFIIEVSKKTGFSCYDIIVFPDKTRGVVIAKKELEKVDQYFIYPFKQSKYKFITKLRLWWIKFKCWIHVILNEKG